MSQETAQIRQEIEATREALTKKITQLEERTWDIVENAKETVQHATDVNYQVDHHPWTMMGLAVLTGYVVGKILSPSEEGRATQYAEPVYSSRAAAPMPSEYDHKPGYAGEMQNGFGAPRQDASSISQPLLQEGLSLLKGAAAGAVFGILKDLMKQALPHLNAYWKTSAPRSSDASATSGMFSGGKGARRQPSSSFPLTPVP